MSKYFFLLPYFVDLSYFTLAISDIDLDLCELNIIIHYP